MPVTTGHPIRCRINYSDVLGRGQWDERYFPSQTRNSASLQPPKTANCRRPKQEETPIAPRFDRALLPLVRPSDFMMGQRVHISKHHTSRRFCMWIRENKRLARRWILSYQLGPSYHRLTVGKPLSLRKEKGLQSLSPIIIIICCWHWDIPKV